MSRVEIEVGAKNTVRPALAEMRKDFRSFSAEIERDIARASAPGRARDSASVFTGAAAARSRQWGEQVSASFNRPAGRGPLADGSAFAAAAAADAEAAAALGKNEAERGAAAARLAAARRNDAMAEATTIGRMKILQGELVALARQRATVEKGSTAELKLQLQIQERYAQFRALGRTAQAERIRLDTAPAERQADGFFGKLRKKFGAGGIGMSLVSGLGFGSAFAVAQSLLEQMTKSWEQSGVFAQRVLEATRKQVDLQKELIMLRGSPGRNTRILEAEAAAAAAAADKAREKADAAAAFAAGKDENGSLLYKGAMLFGRISGLSTAGGAEGTPEERAIKRRAAAAEAETAALAAKLAAEKARKALDEATAAERLRTIDEQGARQRELDALVEDNLRKRLSLEEQIVRVRKELADAEKMQGPGAAAQLQVEKLTGELDALRRQQQADETRAARDLATAQERLEESRRKVQDAVSTPGERITNLQERLAEARTATGINRAAGNSQGAAEAATRENELALELQAALKESIQKAMPEVDSLRSIGLSATGVNYATNPEAERQIKILEEHTRYLRDIANAATGNTTTTTSTASFGGGYSA